MQANAKTIVWSVVAVLVLGFLVWFFSKDKVVTTVVDDDSCGAPPVLAGVSKNSIDVAASKLGDIALGDVKLARDVSVVQVLGETQKNALLYQYLICKAEKSGALKDKTAAEQQKIQEFLAFISTGPTPEQVLEWQRQNLPKSPIARLAAPEFLQDEDPWVLELADVVRTISLVNAGEVPLTAWVGNISPGRLLVKPRTVVNLDAGQHEDVEIGVIAAPGTGPWKLRVGSSALAKDFDVEVRLTNPEAYADLAGAVASDLEAKVGEAPAASETASPADAGPDSATDAAAGAQWIATTTLGVVRKKYPGASDELAWAMTGSLLEQMNWNGPAVIAYRNARAELGESATQLDVPLSRTQLLANVTADPARGEKSPSEVLGSQEADLKRLASLDLASQNLLVRRHPASAQRLATALAGKPSLAPFAQGLTGDVAVATHSLRDAVVAYDACAQATGAPSCTLRKAEAQVALRDEHAAQTTLSQVSAQAPEAARHVTDKIARDASLHAAKPVAKPQEQRF